MIRLVACDVDGTLLMKGESSISANIIDSIKKLVASGVVFVVASGRTYTDLKRLFAEVEKDVVFVSNDGALISYKGTVLAKHPILHKEGFEFMKKVYKKGDVIPVVYSAYMAYVLNGHGEFSNELRYATNNHMLEVECMDSINDDYLKIGLYKKASAAVNVEDIASEYPLNLVYESPEWIEYVAQGINKGSAIEHLQKRFAITKGETMVFGDNTNDLEMFEQADFAYAVDWAADSIREKCPYTTSDVVATLEKICIDR
ncbi:MAG: HAD family phosphatase [Lachnospiraceae bacterium]|nr:HAD family phosphatase [Lachnospiraceae bacterium]